MALCLGDKNVIDARDHMHRNWLCYEKSEDDPENTLAQIQWMVGTLHGRQLWDIGCGPCRATRFFGPAAYNGFDAEKAWQEVIPDGASFHPWSIAQCAAYLPQNSCDVVLCNEVLYHSLFWCEDFHDLWRMTRNMLIVTVYYAPGRIPFLTRHKGARVVLVGDRADASQWQATQNIVPQWMVKRFIEKKLRPRPASVRYHWQRVPGWNGFGIGYAVIQKGGE